MEGSDGEVGMGLEEEGSYPYWEVRGDHEADHNDAPSMLSHLQREGR